MNTTNTIVKLRIVTDPVKTAKMIGLRYVSDETAGIRRVRHGKKFRYVDAQDQPVRSRSELKRIRALVIPPAWQDVWVCPFPEGHIQATGRDDKGRKQYRYHALWQQIRNLTKYHRMIPFGQVLPTIRAQTARALAKRGLPREKVLAAVVRLLDKTCIRVGNEEYARANQSFGLTTMRDEHVAIVGSRVSFQFRGKSGQDHEIGLLDRSLARIVKSCQELPGEELFQYVDDEGRPQKVDSAHVNDFLRELTGREFTAKDFRTWHGTVQAACALRDLGPGTSATQRKKNVCQAIKIAAARLGNKPATCRKYYVHPAILEAYEDGSLLPTLEQFTTEAEGRDAGEGLRAEEAAVMQLLRTHLEKQYGDGRRLYPMPVDLQKAA